MDLGQVSMGAALNVAAQTAQPKLVKAAHEFEAQMMKELLAPMSSAASMNEDGDSSGSGSTDALGEYASQALGTALSQQGGFGIADSIISSLARRGNQISNLSSGTQ